MFILNAKKDPDFFEWSIHLKKQVQNLYCRGNSEILKEGFPRIGVVGTRRITDYGRKVIKHIIPGLAKAGVTIVSGGAFGVDIAAQETAMLFEGPVITVLGSGLNKMAPASNTDFFESVALYKKGLILSQFEPDFPAGKFTFPERNEIISALSDIVLIIEAGDKSGSLITADFALNQGKSIAVIPGRIFDHFSVGTNKLIKEGANLVESTSEILELLPEKYQPIKVDEFWHDLLK